MAVRGTKKFDGKIYNLVESELTKTAANIEAGKLRDQGYNARVLYRKASLRAVKGHEWTVWARKK